MDIATYRLNRPSGPIQRKYTVVLIKQENPDDDTLTCQKLFSRTKQITKYKLTVLRRTFPWRHSLPTKLIIRVSFWRKTKNWTNIRLLGSFPYWKKLSKILETFWILFANLNHPFGHSFDPLQFTFSSSASN